MAALNVERNVSRSTRIDTLTGAQLVPDSGWPCAAKCFSVAMTCRLSANRRVALEPPHGGHAQPRHQVRILAERLLHAPPPRLAGHVHHGRERLVRAARARLGGGHRVQPLDQRRDRTSRRGRSAAGSSSLPSPRARAGTPRGRPPGCRAATPRRRTSESRSSARPSPARPGRRPRHSPARPVRGRARGRSAAAPSPRRTGPDRRRASRASAARRRASARPSRRASSAPAGPRRARPRFASDRDTPPPRQSSCAITPPSPRKPCGAP